MNRPVSWAVGSRPDSSFLGLVEKARSLCAVRGEMLAVVLVSPRPDSDGLRRLGGAGAQMLYRLELDTDDPCSELRAREALAARALIDRPGFILFESSAFFSSVAPGLAAELGCGITADCTALELCPDNTLLQIRPAFGGRTLAYNVNRYGTAIATVRRGVFRAEPAPSDVPPSEFLPIAGGAPAWALLGIFGNPGERADLADARIVLSGGLGMGSRENFRRLFVLAGMLGAAVGASRAAVAAGYAGYELQVGQTGSSVRPEIYAAFGISGAGQHLSGIAGAKSIVAVNCDPGAPIHSVSDFSLVADCRETVEALISRLELIGRR